jgi:abequosyltransferase
MPNKKLLTIAIPTYQREKELRETLSDLYQQYINLSVADQSNVSVIVIDNASTTYNIKDVFHEFYEKLPIIFKQNEKNLGIDGNVKQCILNSNSRFVWLFSDDDLFEDHALRDVLKQLNHHCDKALFVINYNTYDPDIKKILRYRCIKKNSDDMSVLSNLTFISSTLINKEILDTIGLNKFDKYIGSLYYHLAIGYKLADISYKFIDKPLVKFRSNRSNLGGGRIQVALEPYLIFLNMEINNLTCNKRSFFLNNVVLWLKHHKKYDDYKLHDFIEIMKSYGVFCFETFISLIIYITPFKLLNRLYHLPNR